MAPTPLQHRRTHNTLLFQKLLNLRDGASPFTLILDTLEQSGSVIVKEFIGRAKISKSRIIFISFSTLKKSPDYDVFIITRSKTLSKLRSEILSHIPPSPQKTLLIIDTLNPLSSTSSTHLSTFLSSLLVTPQISLLATYHLDVPLSTSQPAYTPSPLTTLTYLSTALLSPQNLSHILARKRARDKSLPEPEWGLAQRREGILIGLSGSARTQRDVVVVMELRRKSGRGVVETFVLSPGSVSGAAFKTAAVTLLDEHVGFRSPSIGEAAEQDGEVETTFSMGLTDKQRRDRDGVVLPYFDAQKDGGLSGPGDGGRILYEMGEEDKEDFDDEEDEI